MYVYRMTMTSPDGTVIELPWEAVKIWCEKLGVNHVPELEKFMFTTQEDLKERVDKYITGMPADEIGKTHIAEGVVVRIDNRESFTAFKDKCFEFKVCEGIIKDTSDVPDMEEAEGRMGDLSYCAEEIDGYFVKYFASADSKSQSTDVEGQSTEAE